MGGCTAGTYCCSLSPFDKCGFEMLQQLQQQLIHTLSWTLKQQFKVGLNLVSCPPFRTGIKSKRVLYKQYWFFIELVNRASLKWSSMCLTPAVSLLPAGAATLVEKKESSSGTMTNTTHGSHLVNFGLWLSRQAGNVQRRGWNVQMCVKRYCRFIW